MKRGDIALCDVFISWTGTDQAIKEAIAVALRSSGILPLLSDERCQGDFEEWSREAATSAHVFMPVITNASLSSVGMGWEIEAYDKKLSSDEGEYFREAFLPIAESLELYQSYLSRLSESSRAILEKHSAILLTFTENRTVSEKSLDEIVTKTAERLSSSFFRLYLQKSSVKHIKLFSLYTENAKDENYSFDDLYVPRTVTRTDTEDAVCLTSPQPLFVPNTVSMIVGAAGSGKTQYVNEIKQAHTDDTLIISLTCTDAAESPLSLFDLLYEEFHRICSQRIFYTKDNFRRLLDIKNLTIVFDGMDEITTKREKRYLVEKIETYYLANTNTALIFTSRDENDADFLALSSTPTAKYRLDSLNPDNITTLSYNLFSLLGVPEQTDAFREKLQELSEGIRTNPLFISQLALVYYETGTLPATEIGILDAVSKIILKSDSQRHKLTVPDRYLDMIEHDITDILKQFSRESYIKNTEGKHLDYSKILHHVVKKKYAEDKDALRSRCQYLSDYLENRAIMESGKFYHKSFLEYFTALSYADKAFDEDYGEIDDDTVIRELFSYYQNPYWEKVIAMFLIQADLTLEDTAMASLYEEILSPDIDEYSLLLHAGQDFVNHRDLTERLIAQKLLTESINGSVAPYGELFWYVPTYHLYHALLCALETLPPDAKALALVRDVAFITGGYATARAIDPSCDSDKLFRRAKASLTGVRRQLCEIFYLSEPTLVESAGIYPRCFDPREAISVKENGHGTFARMQIPFDDELGLFSHEQFPEANGQYLGFVSTMYRKDALEEKLSKKKHDRITVLALTPKQGNHMEYIHFVRSNVRAFYVPETITSFADDATLYMNLIWQIKILDDLPVYLPKHIRTIHIPDTFTVISAGAFQNLTSLGTVILPESLTEIGEKAFENCLSLTDIHLPDSLRRIGNSAFAECQSLKQITLPEGLTDLDAFVFLGCSSLVSAHLSPSLKELPWSTFAFCEALTDVHLPEGLTSIGDMAFAGCSSLTAIDFPKSLEKIGWCAFSACLSLLTAELPEGLREIGIRAFADCTALQSIHLPSTLTMLRENAFENCSSLSEIHLPDSLRAKRDTVKLSKSDSINRLKI